MKKPCCIYCGKMMQVAKGSPSLAERGSGATAPNLTEITTITIEFRCQDDESHISVYELDISKITK